MLPSNLSQKSNPNTNPNINVTSVKSRIARGRVNTAAGSMSQSQSQSHSHAHIHTHAPENSSSSNTQSNLSHKSSISLIVVLFMCICIVAFWFFSDSFKKKNIQDMKIERDEDSDENKNEIKIEQSLAIQKNQNNSTINKDYYNNNEMSWKYEVYATLPKILFLVFRSSIQDREQDGIPAIRETWANENAPYLKNFISNIERDEPLFHIKFISTNSQPFVTKDKDVVIPPYEELKIQQSERESAVALLWAINEYGSNDYEWIFKIDDVTFVHIPNLLYYLYSIVQNSKHITKTKRWWLGCRLKLSSKLIFNSGGAGYLINRPIIDQWIDAWKSQQISYQICSNEGIIWEDLCTSFIMYKILHVKAIDTRDLQGHDRFNVFEPLTLTGLGGIYKLGTVEWYRRYHWYSTPTEGLEYMTREPITYHYVKPNEMIGLFRLIHLHQSTATDNLPGFESLRTSEQHHIFAQFMKHLTDFSTVNSSNQLMNVDREILGV